MIAGAQMRMARGHLRWSVKDLADRSGVSSATIKRMEEVDHMPNAMSDNLARIRSTLEAAGVEFIPENGGGAGLRLKKRNPSPDHPTPSGPATNAVDAMDKAISNDRAGPSKDRLASVKETGEEVPQEQWERFEAADKKPER